MRRSPRRRKCWTRLSYRSVIVTTASHPNCRAIPRSAEGGRACNAARRRQGNGLLSPDIPAADARDQPPGRISAGHFSPPINEPTGQRAQIGYGTSQDFLAKFCNRFVRPFANDREPTANLFMAKRMGAMCNDIGMQTVFARSPGSQTARLATPSASDSVSQSGGD